MACRLKITRPWPIVLTTHVDRSEYLRGYADGQKKVCEEGFIHAWGLAGKSFLPVAIPKMQQNCVRHGKKGWMKVCAPADLINLFLPPENKQL
jgi:hypothetical protein